MNIEVIRDKVLNFRAATGMTQKEFAKAADLSIATVNKLEQGKPVTNLSMARINAFVDNYSVPKHETNQKSIASNMTIREIQKEVHKNAVEHGWWDKPRTEGELLMLVTSEVSEAFEEIRNNKPMNETYYVNGKMEGVPSELADVVIRIMDMSEYYGIDLEKAILEKHEYNKTRPYRHGNKKL